MALSVNSLFSVIDFSNVKPFRVMFKKLDITNKGLIKQARFVREKWIKVSDFDHPTPGFIAWLPFDLFLALPVTLLLAFLAFLLYLGWCGAMQGISVFLRPLFTQLSLVAIIQT
ncbi:MAG: hypothetical protein ACKVX9_00255 [Blastocatellia bacterium]